MSEQTTQPAPQSPAAGQAEQQHKYHLNYETLTAVFADHVVLNSTSGGLIFDFASCTVADGGVGESTVPIHTRIAMTTNGALQLYQLLGGVFPEGQQTQEQAPASPPANG